MLLSVRDPDRWEPSYRETIGEMCRGESLMPLLSRARREIDPRWARYLELVERLLWGPESPFGAGHDPESMKAQMTAYNESVKRAIPSERLLVWEVGEGWQPLCEFLGVPVPEGPLPHVNDRETFVNRVIDGALAALGAWGAERPAPAS